MKLAIDKPPYKKTFPVWYLFFTDRYHISYSYFHNGIGFQILLPGVNIMICTSGVVSWWLPYKLRFNIFGIKYHWKCAN